MQRRQYTHGEVLFREGEPSDTIGRIIEGSVQVIIEDGPRTVLLGHIGKGEFVGEMGIIEDLPRSATVRAESDVTIEWISKEEFLKQVSDNRDTAFQLIARLSERLASLNRAYSEIILSGQPFPKSNPTLVESRANLYPSQLVIFADSPKIADYIPTIGLAVQNYPMIVGRDPEPGEMSPDFNVDLRLPDSKPYRLSRVHFAIQRTQEGFQVRDLESQLGTAVNGAYLGRNFGKDTELLRKGENVIIAGGIDSLFRFRAVF